MTSQRWMNEVPIETLPLESLWVSQEGVYFHAILGPAPAPVGGDPFPHVVELPDGRYVIEDGHSRLSRAAFAGEREMPVRVLRNSW